MSTHKNMIDKALQLADSGVEIAKGELRANSEYNRAESEQPFPRVLDGRGEIDITVTTTTVHPDYPGEYVADVISFGTYYSGSYTAKKGVQAILKLDNPGNYFIAVVGELAVGAGSDLTGTTDPGGEGGTIYGNKLSFNPDPVMNSISVWNAEYNTSCILAQEDVDNNYVVFTDPNVSWPEQVDSKVLPVVSVELMHRYYIAATTVAPSSLLQHGTQADPLDCGGSQAPLTFPENGSNVWYWPNTGDPLEGNGGSLYINKLTYDFFDPAASEDKSCIVVVNGSMYISGDIAKNDQNADYTIGFIVKGNVFIELDQLTNNLTIEGTLFIATNGRFSVVGSTIHNSFNFSGAALFSDKMDLARGFNVRTYTYDPMVKNISNLPFLVYPVEYTVFPN
ncbi:MAG: hypothetical protein ABII23_01715, partial [bacterium]